MTKEAPASTKTTSVAGSPKGRKTQLLNHYNVDPLQKVKPISKVKSPSSATSSRSKKSLQDGKTMKVGRVTKSKKTKALTQTQVRSTAITSATLDSNLPANVKITLEMTEQEMRKAESAKLSQQESKPDDIIMTVQRQSKLTKFTKGNQGVNLAQTRVQGPPPDSLPTQIHNPAEKPFTNSTRVVYEDSGCLRSEEKKKDLSEIGEAIRETSSLRATDMGV